MIEELRRVRNQRPFVPYSILLEDGSKLFIRDQFHVGMSSTVISIYDEAHDRFLHLYDDADIREIKVDGTVVWSRKEANSVP